MSPRLRDALNELARVCDEQERAFRAAQAAPQEFFIIGATRRERKKNDPRYNETAGARVAADKEVVIAARNVVRVYKEEEVHEQEQANNRHAAAHPGDDHHGDLQG